MFIFAVAVFVLPSMLVGFWLGQRAKVARMHWIGVIETDPATEQPIARWVDPVVPLGASLYVERVPLRHE